MNVQTRIAAYSCPCCKGFIGEAAPIDAVIASVNSSQQRLLLKALAKTIGMPIGGEELMDALFGWRKKKPTAPRKVFRQAMTDVRKKIEPSGWTIVTNTAGRGGSVYRLIPTVGGA